MEHKQIITIENVDFQRALDGPISLTLADWRGYKYELTLTLLDRK